MKQISAKISILLALLFLLISVILGVTNYLFMTKAEKTEARVKSIDKGHRRITPVFEYKVNNKTYEFEGSSTSYGEYEIGDTEIIYYDPGNPENSKVGTFMNLWFVTVFCGGFFIVLSFAGILMALQKSSANRFGMIKTK